MPQPTVTRHRRTIKLIRPGLQLRLILVFLATSTLALLFQLLLFMSELTQVALDLPHDGLVLVDGVNRMVWTVLAISLGVFLPVTFVIGVLTTHRFAGPVYRFEVFLKQVARGERPPPCKLRKGDELNELCALINEATAPLRAPAPAVAERVPESPVPPAALPATPSTRDAPARAQGR